MSQFPETALIAITIAYCLYRMVRWLCGEANYPQSD